MTNPNVLSQRYVTNEINQIFSQKGKILMYRELWISIMKAQRKIGINIPNKDIEKFEKSKNNIDLDDIKSRERKTKHDIKANIESFVKVANASEHIHKGMTSRDLTDNVEQMQILKASKIILGKAISILKTMLDKSKEYENIIITARTHNQPAQATVLGKRFSMWAEEIYFHIKDFENFIDMYPLRGIKGAVGTQLDMGKLLENEKIIEFEKIVANQLGFKQILKSTGQIYSRSFDLSLISKLVGLSSACENFATSIRLMSGYELVTEGFKEGQVGSSAMPHKMNTRSSERINGFGLILKGYLTIASNLSGNQWDEGDVSCSAPRRIFISDSFYTIDGLFETTLTILNEMKIYENVIEKEVEKYLPFLASTQILMLAIKKGMGREDAHLIIKKYAINEITNLRNGKKQNFAEKISKEKKFNLIGITQKEINSILENKNNFIGKAKIQINEVCKKTEKLLDKYLQESLYKPKEIL